MKSQRWVTSACRLMKCASTALAIVYSVVLLPVTALANPFPPTLANGAAHYNPAPWPSEPADPANCGSNCGNWKPYTRFQNSVNDPRVQDTSNGGTAPQNYVNIASSCSDKTQPSIYYYLHQGATPADDVIMFRWRVEQIANNYATGPSAGSYSSSDPWSSALWTVLFDVDGSGYRTLAAHLNGSSGNPSEPIDMLAGIWSNTPSQSIDYINDPTNIHLLAHNPTAFSSGSTILNFNGDYQNPTTSWSNGSSESTWDYGTSRARLISTRSCNEYFVDYQIPVAMLDASAFGGPSITRSTPISMMFCTANSLNNPFQKDCAINRTWAADGTKPAPFGDYISFDKDEPYSQPIVSSVTATAPASCGQSYTLVAKVQDALPVVNGVVTTSVQDVDFYYWYDSDGDGTANENDGVWMHAASASLVSGTLNTWSASWNASTLPKGKYLIGVQAVDDNSLVDDGMTPTGVDNRTFSYLPGDSNSEIYIDGSWILLQQIVFPDHSPAMTPGATENWYGNPDVTGIQTALIGVALNTCGVAPTLGLTADKSEVAPGEIVNFTLTVSNTGNSDAITVDELSAVLPGGFSYTNASTSGDFGSSNPVTSGQTLTWSFGLPVTIAANGTAALSFNATASSVSGNYNTTSSAVTSFGNLASDPVAVSVGSARLALSITPGTYSTSLSGQVTYIFNYTNPSTVAVSGASLGLTLPANTTFVSCTGSCTGTTNVSWSLATLDPGESGSVNLVLEVSAAYSTTSLTTSATLSGTDPGSNTVTATASATIYVNVPVGAIAAFTLEKTSSVVRIAPGGGVTYTLTYHNYGGAAASSVVITDTLPSGMTYSSCTGSCVNSSGTITWNVGTVAAGASSSVTVTATGASPFTSANPAVNNASINWSGGTPVTATVSTGVTGQSCSTYYFRNSTANVGFDGTYRLATALPVPLAGDIGSSITVTAPTAGSAYLEAIRYYQDPATGADTDFSGNVSTSIWIDRNPGQALHLRATLYDYNSITGARTQLGQTLDGLNDYITFNGSTTGELTFNVPVSGTLQKDHRLLWTVEVRSSHNSQTVPVQIQFNGTVTNTYSGGSNFADSGASFCVAPPANLTINKSVDSPTVPENTTAPVVYTISYSNTGSSNATNTAIVDTLPTGVSFTSATLNSSPITPTGSNPYTFAVGTVAGGGSGTLVINASVSNTATGTLVNTAAISSDQTSSVSDTASTLVGAPSSGGGGSVSPALYMSKSASTNLLGASSTVTFTLTVVNAGDAAATAVVVTDNFPDQSYFSYVSCTTATGTCNQSPAGTLSWNVGTLAAGDSATLTYQMQTTATGITDGITNLNNSASVSDADYCTGTPPASCTSNIVTVSVSGNPDLAIAVTANDLAVIPGDVIEYTITVTNNGSSTASDVVIANPIPDYTGFVAFTLNPSSAGSFDTINNRVLVNVGDLNAGATATYKFTVEVISPLASGNSTITDAATVSAGNAASVSDSVSSTATAAPIMSVSISGENNIPLPATTLATSVTSSTVFEVNSAALLGVGDHLRVNGTFVQITSIAGNFVTVDSAVTANAGTAVYLGGVFTIAYQNTGNAAATNVEISLPLVSGWGYTVFTPTGTSGVNERSWSLGTVAAGGGGIIQFVAIPQASGSFTHTATLTADGSISEQDTVTTLVGGLTVTKSAAQNSAAAGDNVNYTITLTNSLNVAVNGVVVTDALPSGFTFVSSTTTHTNNPGDTNPQWTVNVAANSSVTIQFTASVSANAGAATYQNEVNVTASSGVAQFDALATTDEDITVLSGSGLISGAITVGGAPLAGLLIEFDDDGAGGQPPYVTYTNSAGQFRQVLPAGSNWQLNIGNVAGNSASLAGLTLTSGTDPETINVVSGASIARNFAYSFTAPTVDSLVTNDTTPAITGSYPDNLQGGVLTVTVNGVTYSVGADLVVSGSDWTLTIPNGDALAEDIYDITATITVGNSSADDATSNELVVDTTPPVVPTVNNLLTDVMPILTGTATLGSGETLSITINGATYDNVPVSSGNWTLNTGTATASSGSLGMFDPGMTYSVDAVATDAAGNSSTDITGSEVEIISNDSDGDGTDDAIDTDDDNDGIPDSVESLLLDTDGDGTVDRLDLDSDDDGIADANEGTADTDGDGVPDRIDLDSDNDGIPDAIEGNVDTDGDGIIDSRDLDSDNDGLFDLYETGLSDPLVLDENRDGRIDDTYDVGVNGLADVVELADDYTGALNYTLADTDGDTVPDFRDLDSDNDGIYDVVEAGGSDPDNDGILGTGVPSVDTAGIPLGGGFSPVDSDGDGIPDQREVDADGDTVPDVTEGGGDADADGIPDFQDNNDADNDGVLDMNDLDDDNDGISDAMEGDGNIDTDADGIADSLDLDSDNDGILDIVESGIEDPAALDTDNNGRIDDTFAVGANGLADVIETSIDSGSVNYNGGVAEDTDTDGVPDFRDLDADNDGVYDVIEAGGSDPDDDGIIGTGTPDVNTNGIPARGGLLPIDSDNDGIPDYRQADSAPLVVTIRTGLKGIGAMDNTWLLLMLVPVLLTRVSRNKSLLLLALLIPGMSSAEDSDEFKRRMYVGAGIGQSILEPQTDGTIYSLDDNRDFGYRLLVGYDVNSFLSVDLSYSDLGTASLSPTGTIDYIIPSANVLFYFYDQGAADHIGWGAYLKGGIGSIQNDATVPYERVNSLQVAFGGGFEYGWDNNIAARLDLETYDEDASLLTIGLMYRFGGEKKPEPVVIVEPKDADKDGVIDEQDVCPETSQGTVVDTKGCELDSDGDGVFDSKDACPATPAGSTVDEKGCVPDGDVDGVANTIDQCPNTISGAAVNAVGCAIFETRIEGVNFKTGSAELTDNAKVILDAVVEALASIPTVRVQVQAHTDNVGKEKANQKLSDERARSVVTYLTSKGIAADRMESIGFGESQPVADNKTEEGRAQNRRVEFKVISETPLPNSP